MCIALNLDLADYLAFRLYFHLSREVFDALGNWYSVITRKLGRKTSWLSTSRNLENSLYGY